jgi:hypothetical protein
MTEIVQRLGTACDAAQILYPGQVSPPSRRSVIAFAET